jgi:biopolymer transport protein ExbD
MLVLLIIFMVAAPLATVSLKLDLPPPIPIFNDPKEPVYVTIQTSGALFIADKATTMETLAVDVCAAVGGERCTDERVFVRAQPDVAYDRFMAVMNGLQANRFQHVGLLNEDID